MFDILKNFENQNCQSFGFCMQDPRMSGLYELLINEIRQIAFYAVKINEYKIINEEILSNCIEALCVDFSNINFNEKDFIDMYKVFLGYKIQISKIYKNIHEKSTIPYEIITNPYDKYLKNSIIDMIRRGQKLLKANHLFVNEKSESLFELIQVLIKDASRNVSKIKDFDKNYTKYDFEILRFLNITNFPSTRAEKLKRRIREFIDINYQIRKDFYKILENHYGKRTSTTVNLSPLTGKSILVSGDNFKDLELILEASKDKNINVYTHDMLFIAHSYTGFRNYKNLKGHFGTNNPRLDFSNFKGAIYVTKHYEQRIDSVVKGDIFATNSIMPKGISKIENNNFDPLIKASLEHEGFDKQFKKREIKVPYNENDIKDKSTVIVGENDTKNESDNTLKLSSPSEISLLYDICENKNKIKSIIFSNCHLQTLILAFILKIKFGYDIQFGKCPNYYINPNLTKCLKDEYGIEFKD